MREEMTKGFIFKELYFHIFLIFIIFILLTSLVTAIGPKREQGKGPLTLQQVQALIQEKMPDKTIAGEIRSRGLNFVPTKDIVDNLRRLGAGMATIQAINAFRPWLEEAKQVIPVHIREIYQALNDGNPARIRHLVTPNLFSSAEELDAICFPYRYRAHYIENIMGRAPDGFLAHVRVLFQPMEEHAYILFFRVIDDNFILEGFDDLFHAQTKEGGDWLDLWKKMAEDVAKKFFYAAKAGNKEILARLVSPGVELDPLYTPRAQEEIAATGDTIPKEFSWIISDLVSDRGLKVKISYESQPPGISFPLFWRFIVDCIDGAYQIVSWKIEVFAGGAVGFDDPNVESHTLKRFGLQK